MLDNETKRRIDTARDILVGKLPDPKSQVEQITIALIYKFMDDMDAQAVEYDGDPSFFVGDYEKYGWRKLFAPNLSGHERLALYGEAIVKLNVNPHLPALFRDIFKNAYLPYRDPETLALFLKTINEFKYDHSERLGDAFEYLLSVLGSQGDAGQFRTPRHIIDFIVKTLAPKKNETICDPACGTAGFLISSYKYILNDNKRSAPGDTLTPDERKRLMTNFVGYDISPDMVRLSLVNLYLHGFPSPTIHEYDSLTSEDRWNETFDIVMANPPFMSPKGGIKPHKKFSISANRSEVLFVDYIAEHIHPTHGRAGIIVPEGIIFQGAGAYKDLRKMLVDKAFLYAVVSLPAGVFQPYSGVKTSILLMDKTLAAKTDKILFVKIQNDGFGLGAQRRELATSNLPDAMNLIRDFQQAVLHGDTSRFEGEDLPLQAVTVEKTQIATNGDYNLSGDRYKTSKPLNHKFELVELDKICIVGDGNHSSNYPKSSEMVDSGVPFIRGINLVDGRISDREMKFVSLEKHQELKKGHLQAEDILFTNRGEIGKIAYVDKIFDGANLNSQIAWLRSNKEVLLPKYLMAILQSPFIQDELQAEQNGATLQQFTIRQLKGTKIPLPPLSIQKEIVEKIEAFQRILDGAKQVVENYKPQIDISPDWEMVELGKADTEIIDGDRGVNYPSKEDFKPEGYCLFLNTKNVRQEGFLFNELEFITKEKDESLRKGKLKRNDVVMTTRGTIGNIALYNLTVPFDNIRINSGMLIFRPKQEIINSEYLFTLFKTQFVRKQFFDIASGSAQPQLPIRSLVNVKIPIPPLKVQQEIVVSIEREQLLINSNKELITIFETKIKDEINKLWEE